MGGSNSLGKLFIELGLKSSLKGDLGQAQAQVGNFDSSVGKLNTTMSTSSAALLSYGTIMKGAFATAVVAGVGYVSKAAISNEALENSFHKLVEGQGKDVDTYLENLKRASYGTITETSLMQQTNRALLLGLDADVVESMAKGATVIAQATGDSSSYLFESLALGSARQSKLLLDNLGILVDTDTAYEKYAQSVGKTVSALTEQERKTAFLDATMQGLNERVESLGGYSNVTQSEIDQLKTSLADMSVNAGTIVVPAINGAVTAINDWGDAGGWAQLEQIFSDIGVGFADLGAVTYNTGATIVDSAEKSASAWDTFNYQLDELVAKSDILTGLSYGIDTLAGREPGQDQLERKLRILGADVPDYGPVPFSGPSPEEIQNLDMSSLYGPRPFDISVFDNVDLFSLRISTEENKSALDTNTEALKENTETIKQSIEDTRKEAALNRGDMGIYVDSGYSVRSSDPYITDKYIQPTNYNANRSGVN